MKLAYFWTWQNWALLFLNMAAESAVFYLAAKRGFFGRLITLPVLALFCLLADTAALLLAFTVKVEAAAGPLYSSRIFWNFYSGEQLISGVLLLLLALQIVTVILPPWDRVIALLTILTFSGLAIAYLKLIPGNIIAAVTVSGFIALLALPLIALVSPQEWPKGLGMVTAGLIVTAVLQAGCGIAAGIFKTLAGAFNLGMPLAALLGMLFFVAGIQQAKNLTKPDILNEA